MTSRMTLYVACCIFIKTAALQEIAAPFSIPASNQLYIGQGDSGFRGGSELPLCNLAQNGKTGVW
jgi:hypothetical protein